ncbi:MAG: hypothetical protein NW200_09860, partial [Hyphomonadaceae bacterium]|nr:hypothetical protein [Hyphomonadaceae bacterium]
GAPACDTAPARPACPPARAGLVHRYNRLVALLAAPQAAAQRVARRLAAAPGQASAVARRVWRAAAPRTPWRTGFDHAPVQALTLLPPGFCGDDSS